MKTVHVSTPKRLAMLVLAAVLTIALGAGSLSPAYAAQSVKISKTKATVTAGNSLTLKVSGTKATISWSSSNKKVATVSKTGKVTAVKAGKATITATYKANKTTKALKCAVTVNAKPPALSKTKAALTVGNSLTLKVSGTKAALTWASSDKKIATVNKSGKITAVKAGKTTITATFTVNKKKTTLKCALTVSAKPAPAPAPAPTPAPTPVPETPIAAPDLPVKADFAKATVALPTNEMSYAVNYITAAIPAGSTGYTFSINGSEVAATPVFADGSLVKIAVPAGITDAAITAKKNGMDAGSADLAFAAAGLAEPKTLYGTIAMKFSEYFHDVTAQGALPTETAFAQSGTVADPKLFITQGTRSGGAVSGTQTMTYAAAEAQGLPYVDAVSSATYGDTVHFVPDGNLTLTGGDRMAKTDPTAAITGITAAESGAAYDLYANAIILKKLGKATAQSQNVAAKLTGGFTLISIVKADGSVIDALGNPVAAPGVYKPKLMLTDGNWGERVTVNEAAAKDLPGEGNNGEAEDVAYGGNWGDKVTGFSFGDATALGADYSGANYWDNFANTMYGGIITDSEGHSEPLVFLQNIFSHRMHTDFDVAISPSRFSRLADLKPSGTYTATVFFDGFKDVTFTFDVKNYTDTNAVIDGSTTIVPQAPTVDQVINIKGLTNSATYISGFKLTKGGVDVSPSLYSITANGSQRAKLTLKPALFSGTYAGAYTLFSERELSRSKSLTLTVSKVTLSLATNGADTGTGYTDSAPFEVSKTGDSTVYFVGANPFAVAIVNTGTNVASTSNIQQKILTGSGWDTAVVADTALKRTGNDTSNYCIDITSDKFVVGETYKLTLISTGYATQTFYVKINA